MKKTFTVKSREHYGSKSLDLTIPAEIVRVCKINPGDIFKVEWNHETDSLVLKYNRIFENAKKDLS